MLRCWLIALFFVSYGAAVFAAKASLSSNDFMFENLKQSVSLTKQGDGYLLQQGDRTTPVQLTNRLLVKTTLAADVNELKQLVAGIEQAQLLAKLQNAKLWLVTLDRVELQSAMALLNQSKVVIYAQPDLLQTRQFAQLPARGIAQSEQSLQVDATKKQVRLAIIDDGFNFQHPGFAEVNLAFEYDADRRIDDASPKDVLDQHGTLVAGLIAATTPDGKKSVAPDAQLIAIRQVSSWTSDMVLAFSVARMMKADIVNSSWVLSFLPEPLFDLLTDWMANERPYLVFAAGNNQRDACEVNALSQLKSAWLIGAANKVGERMGYSNFGSCVTLYAPAQFMSTSVSGYGYKAFSGTSAATAYISGVLAKELAAGNRPDKSTMRLLINNSDQKH